MNPTIRRCLKAIRDRSPASVAIAATFWWRLGYFPRLWNPRSFNEKLQWLKLYDKNEFYRICADKIAVRDVIRERVGEEYLIPLLGVFNSPDDLQEELLPDEPFVLKTNHDSGTIKIVRDKSAVDWPETREFFRRKMAIDYSKATREWYYSDIDPVILCEKLLMEESGVNAYDFKFYCFGGKAKMVLKVVDRAGEARRGLFDIEWSIMPWEWDGVGPLALEKPNNLTEMIAVAEKLSSGFPHVRVDLYSPQEKIYAGELTMHVGGGFSQFIPRSVDFEIGEMLTLPPKSG